MQWLSAAVVHQNVLRRQGNEQRAAFPKDRWKAALPAVAVDSCATQEIGGGIF